MQLTTILKKNEPAADHQLAREQTEKQLAETTLTIDKMPPGATSSRSADQETARFNQAEARAWFLAMADEGFRQIIAAQASEKSIAEAAPDAKVMDTRPPVTVENQTQPLKVNVQLPAEKPLISNQAAEPSPVSRPELPATDSGNERQALEIEILTAKAADDYISVDELADRLPEASDISDTDTLPIQEILPLPPEAGLTGVDASAGEEIIFDEEVMDTFEQLVILIDLEQEEMPLVASEPYETSMPDEIILLSQELAEAIQANETNAFEEFVMAKTPPEISPDIDAIVAGADDQLLEETFVQLSYCLAEATAEPTDKGRQIGKALKELAEMLPPSQADYKGQEQSAAITLELTQKLLLLLQAVGYDGPREVLVGFIERNDFEFLLQAIRYLHQLANEPNRQEFVSNKSVNFTAVVDNDEPLAARLGRAIMRRFFLPDPATP